MMKRYFFDSYALIELVKANPKYIPYLDSQVTITIFNLVEFTYSILQDYGENKAKEFCLKFKECVIDIDENIILEALKFRKEHHRRDLSYADCIGYICAKRFDLLFLTGDEQFRDLPNVEFVKK